MSNVMRWNWAEAEGQPGVCVGDHENSHACEYEPVEMWHINKMREEIDRLRQRVAELEKDAERYRWLRDAIFKYDQSPFDEIKLKKLIETGMSEADAFDYGIDAAMESEGESDAD